MTLAPSQTTQAVVRASRLMAEPDPAMAEVDTIDGILKEALSQHDPFFVRWRFFVEYLKKAAKAEAAATVPQEPEPDPQGTPTTGTPLPEVPGKWKRRALPKILRVQPAPYDTYLEIEIIVRGRDGTRRVQAQDKSSIGAILGRPVRTVSTVVGYAGERDRHRLSNHITAFVRHVLEQRATRSIEDTIDEATRGKR